MSDSTNHKVNMARVKSAIVLSRFKSSVAPNKRAYNRRNERTNWKKEAGE